MTKKNTPKQAAQKAAPVSTHDLVFPNDANPYGSMFGGKLMAIMDKTAALAAMKYARRVAVTASSEAIDFVHPVRIGDQIETRARVVWTGHSSMIVKVEVFANKLTRPDPIPCTSAHFTFVALDEEGHPTPVPPLLVSTKAEKMDHTEAEIVKKKALERKKKIDSLSK